MNPERFRPWQRLGLSLLLLLFAACGGGGGSGAAGGDGGSPASGPPPAGGGDAVPLRLERLFSGLSFSQPVFMLQRPGDADSWYLVEKGGAVQRFQNVAEAVTLTTVIDLGDRVDAAPSEAGLLGMAFDPDFAQSGRVYLSYTAPGPGGGAVLVSRLSRFLSPDGGLSIDPASEEILLSLEQPFTNHNGGHLAFGPDGLLYIGFGDGGSGGDPLGHGQNPDTLLGALLRIDVSGASAYAIPLDNPFVDGGGRGEIFAFGLRNPWRWSFDRGTGDIWLGDVGQNQWEEIDRIVAGGNYGWNIREGAHCFGAADCPTLGLIDPVTEYSHTEGCSVTGGYVYRGTRLSSLTGTYLYADFCSGTLWGFDPQSGESTVLLQSAITPSSFAQGADGELYLLDFAGGGIWGLRP